MESLIDVKEVSNCSNAGRFSIRFVIAVAAIPLTVLFFSRSSFRKKQKLPPGPRGWPLVGSLPSLSAEGGKLVHRTLLQLSKKHGPLMYLWLGFKGTLVVSNSEMAREIVGTHDLEFASRPHQVMATLFLYDQKDIGFSSYGPHWRQLRKICSAHLFTTSRLKHFKGVRERETIAVVNSVLRKSENGIGVNMSEQLAGFTMNITTQMMWNKRHVSVNDGDKATESENFVELIRSMLAALAFSSIADCLPFGKTLAVKLLGWDKKAKIIQKKLDNFIDGVLSEHQQLSSVMNPSELDVTEEDNFVQVLLKLSSDSNSNAKGLSRDTIKATLLDMILGGTDTPAVTLEWALAEMIKNPSLRQKATEELKQVIGENRLVNESDVPNLKYLQAVIKETLRLHQPSPLAIPHYNKDDCKVSNFVVPANSTVLLNIYAIQRDPSLWERPTEFDPSRFLGPDMDALDFRGRDCRFLPFGSGRRICPAMSFAVSTLQLALAQLLHAVSWSLPGDDSHPENLDMTEIMGVNCSKAIPLTVIAKPRLAHHITGS